MKSFKNSKKNLKVRKLRSKKLLKYKKNKKSSIKYVGGTPPPGITNNGMMTVSRAMQQRERPQTAVQQSQRRPQPALPQPVLPQELYTELGRVKPVPPIYRQMKAPTLPTDPLYINLGNVAGVNPRNPIYVQMKALTTDPVYARVTKPKAPALPSKNGRPSLNSMQTSLKS